MFKYFGMILLLSGGLLSSAFADTLILNSGEQVRGEIIEETADHLTVSVGGTNKSYPRDTVQRIVPNYGNGEDVSLPEPSVVQDPVTAQTSEPSKVAGNAYVNDEYRVSLVPPAGWYVVDGKEDRDKRSKELDEEITSDKLMKKANENPSGEKCPLVKDPQFMTKMAKSLKAMGMGMLPLVSIYHDDPKSREGVDKERIACIKLYAKEESEPEGALEQFELITRLSVNMSKGKMLFDPAKLEVGGVPGIWIAFQVPNQGFISSLSTCAFVKDNTSYRIDFTGKGDDFEAFKKDIEGMIKSIGFR
jgi:hypothetical protein